MEEKEVSKEQDCSTEEGSGAPTCNTETHFSVALLHLLEPCSTKWMHVVCSQMEDIVDGKSDEHDHSDGLVWAELLAIPVHKGDDTEDDDCHAEDGGKTGNEVASNHHQNNEWEADGGNNTLECPSNKCFLWWNVDPSITCLEDVLHTCWSQFLLLVNEALPFFKLWFLDASSVPLVDWNLSSDKGEDHLTVSETDFGLRIFTSLWV